MNTIREIQKINEQELDRGIAGTSASWHAKYSKSPWVYVGNLHHSLSEGDVICVLSQYGEIEDIHLVRDEETGQSRGFAFCKYEDARSCVLAVDNFTGVQLCGRSMRVDHVENYRLPKHIMEKEEEEMASSTRNDNSSKSRTMPGHAYDGQELENEFSLRHGQDLFAPPPAPPPPVSEEKVVVKDNRSTTRTAAADDVNDKDNGDDAKRRRKEERKRKREEKEIRRRVREEKRMEKEERKRERRALNMRNGDGDDCDDGSTGSSRRRKKHKRHKRDSEKY